METGIVIGALAVSFIWFLTALAKGSKSHQASKGRAVFSSPALGRESETDPDEVRKKARSRL